MRVRLEVSGLVQGVGFRPFVYRLAERHGLAGWVCNDPGGAVIEVQGSENSIDSFLEALEEESPPACRIDTVRKSPAIEAVPDGFRILASEHEGLVTAGILPDLGMCPDCRRELFDPANRRYRHPFINCTNCGPRFSIVRALPYDRANTTMAGFQMCPECRAEYEDPHDRRFHAQPNACPQCGPHAELWAPGGQCLARREDAIAHAIEVLRAGAIVAIKGIGGFHLACDAMNAPAVAELRRRKHREEKPLAIMAPSLAWLGGHCEVSEAEAMLLGSPAAPIVLLRRVDSGSLSGIAPGNPWLGAMLPYAPLHALILAELGRPIVATSGNLSEEPICIDNEDALRRLSGIPDFFLVHNRPIARQVDDSLVRIVDGRVQMLRRARGFAPAPIRIGMELPSLLALGGQLKNTVAISVGDQVVLGQHMGDLDNLETLEVHRRTVADFRCLYNLQPGAVTCDLHPDYLSTREAERSGLAIHRVQHHEAHVWSAIAEHGIAGPLLGVSWDGTGYGGDGTIWGGEFFRFDGTLMQRVASLLPFPLAGGDRAAREPRRSALGLVYTLSPARARDIAGDLGFSSSETTTILAMMAQSINCPLTSSMGRLFDGVSALLGVRRKSTFEGQAAMELEHVSPDGDAEPLPFGVIDGEVPRIDWRPMIESILAVRDTGIPAGVLAARFHATLVEIIVAVARREQNRKVVLTGGCFQNRRLLEGAIARLRRAGFDPAWNQAVPCNDGGLALGQLAGASANLR